MSSHLKPLVIGSILIGADALVGEMVKSRIPHMRGGEWGPYIALGVVRRGKLVGGVVYHGYRGFDVQISAAFDHVGWALPGTLRALAAYPFLDLKVERVSVVTGRKNKKARKLLRDLGFRFVGVAKRGLDGTEDAFIFEILKDNCKWLKDRPHGIISSNSSNPA
jgi:RimJ/RimL family protein N-acetyltransferase